MQPAETTRCPTDVAQPAGEAERNQVAIDLLRSWLEEGDAGEQRDTGAYLIRMLAEDPIMIGRVPNGDRA